MKKPKETVQGISAGEVLANAFKIFCLTNHGEELIFPKGVITISADESDGHRTRQGFMTYRGVKFFEIRKKVLAMGIGNSWGDYPARNYHSDLIAVDVTELQAKPAREMLEEIQDLIRYGEFFRYTMLIARNDNHIAVSRHKENRFSKKLLELLRPVAAEYLIPPFKGDKDYISKTDILPVGTSIVRYSSAFAVELEKYIEEVLYRESS